MDLQLPSSFAPQQQINSSADLCPRVYGNDCLLSTLPWPTHFRELMLKYDSGLSSCPWYPSKRNPGPSLSIVLTALCRSRGDFRPWTAMIRNMSLALPQPEMRGHCRKACRNPSAGQSLRFTSGVLKCHERMHVHGPVLT